MLQVASVLLMALAIAATGISRCQSLRNEQAVLAEYLRAIERLQSLIRYQREPLAQAFRRTASGCGQELAGYFQALSRQLTFEDAERAQPPHPIRNVALPLEELCAGMDLEGQLRALEGLHTRAKQAFEQMQSTMEQKCRTALSLSLSLAAISAIVLV